MAKKAADIWEPKPVAADYQAAHDYLTLLFSKEKAAKIVQRLRAAPTTHHDAKDLLRASQTHLLPKDNPQVQSEIKKIKKGKKLSPVLLVRGDALNGITLTIADGQHRICGSWHWDEDCPVACCLASAD